MTDSENVDHRKLPRSSSKTIEKTINGVEVTQTTFKRAVVEAFEAMADGAGRVEDLIPFLGDEWDTPDQRKVLAKTLANMAGGGKLKRDPERRGLYRVAGIVRHSGVSVRDQQERSIIQSIRRRGGVARFSEIMEDHGLRAHGEDLKALRAARVRRHHGTETDDDMRALYSDVRAQTGYQQLLKIMATSPRIRQDYAFHRAGLYNLPQDEMNALPLRGLYASFMIKTTLGDFERDDMFLTMRDEFYTRVGDVFQTARNMRRWSRPTFVQRPRVMAALSDLARNRHVDRLLRSHYRDMIDAKIADMKARGVPPTEIADFRMNEGNSRDGRQYLIDILERFELGGRPLDEGMLPAGTNIHTNASVTFYEVLAEELGIDPVAATRGFLSLDVRGEKVRPRRNLPTPERRAELEEARSRVRAANRSGNGSAGVLIIPD